jgi:hypothetical protein
LLVALANAQVVAANLISQLPVAQSLSSTAPTTPSTTQELDLIEQWLLTLKQAGYQMPDKVRLPVADGLVIAAAYYKQARIAVILENISTEVQQRIHDKGGSTLVMSDPQQWLTQFAANPQIFGTGN